MAFEGQNMKNGNILAGADLSAAQFKAVKMSGAAVVLCDAAGEKPYGILQNKPASGYVAEVATKGVVKAMAGAAITAGADIMVNASGKVITAENSVLTATGTLNFASIATTASEDLTIAVAGAAVGDTVELGLPAAPAAGLVFMAFVSAADTVTVRAMNITGTGVEAASASYKVAVFRKRYAIGKALEAAGADGDIIAVDLQPAVQL